MTQKKSYFQKLLSVFLAVLMCLSVCVLDWSCILPTASATSAGKYYVKLVVQMTETDSQSSGDYISITYKSNNGTGTATTTGNYSYDGTSSGEKTLYNGELSGYPTSLYNHMHLNGDSSEQNAWVKITLYVGSSSSSLTPVTLSSTNGETSNSGGKYISCRNWTSSTNATDDNYTITVGDLPVLKSISVTGDTSVTANDYGGVAKEIAYSATAKDQYGVSFATTINWSKTDGYGDKCSFSSNSGDSTELKVPAASGQDSGSKVVVKASSGSVSGTTTLTIKINKYYVDLNGNLDGENSGNVANYGKGKVTIGGTVVDASCTDYWAEHESGKTYKIENAGADAGRKYDSGAASGTIKSSTVSVRLKYKTQSSLVVNPNDGTWGGKTGNSTNTNTYGATLTVAEPTRTNYTFNGWTKSENFKGTLSATTGTPTYTYNSKTANGVDTITANWLSNYTIVFDANSGTGSTASMDMVYGTAKNLTTNGFSKANFEWIGWGTKASDTSETYNNNRSVSNLTDKAGGTVTLYALWKREITTTFHTYSADGATDNTSTDTKTAYNTATSIDFTTPAASAVATTVTKADKTWTLMGWKEGTDAIWGKSDQTADVGFGATATVSVTGEKDDAHAFYPVYALKNTKFYANYYFYQDEPKEENAYAYAQEYCFVDGDAKEGAMPVPNGSDSGADAKVQRYYSKDGIIYELQGWALAKGATEATISYATVTTNTATLDVPGAGYPTSTANQTPIAFYPVYDEYATAIYVDFIYYTDNGVANTMTVAGRAVGEETTGEVEFPANSQVPATSYVDGGRTYTLVGWSATPDSETYDGFGKKIEVAKLDNPTANHHTFYPVYSTETSVQYRYNSVENGVLKTDNYIAKAGATRGGTTANSNTKWSTIPVPTAVDVSAINTYKYQGITYELVGWEKTEAETSTCRTTATFKIGEANTTNEQVTADNAPYIYYPVYKVVKKDLYGQLHYYDANGADKTYEVSTANVTFTAWETGATASGVITFPAVASISSIVKSYTKNGRTYTLLGWSESANSEMTVSGASRDVTWNNNVKDSYDFYPVYETTTNIKYGYTVMEGTKAVTEYVVKSGKTTGGDDTNCNSKTASIAVPTAADLGSGLTYKKDGLTYELVGWEREDKGAAGLDVTEVTFELGQDAPTTEQVTANGSDYIYYPVYKIIKKDYVARYHYYDAAGKDTHFEVTTPDIARAATQATVTMPSSSQITYLSYVGKVNGKDVTYTLIGWNQDPASTSEKTFTTQDTIALEDNTVTIINFYPVYEFTTSVKYNYYNAAGQLAYSEKSTVAKKANLTIPETVYVAMPGTDATPDITLNSRTFSINGWSTETASAQPAEDCTSVRRSLNVAVQDTQHVYYGIYANSNFTLTYNGTMKTNSVATNLPETQTGSQYINAGTGIADISNASDVTFTINYSVVPVKDGYTFIGWDTSNSEEQSATYIAGDPTKATITDKSNITLYARFMVNTHGVTFYYYNPDDLTGERKYTVSQDILHDDLTRDDTLTNNSYRATSPIVTEAIGGVTKEKIAHVDGTYHYVFEKWIRSDGKSMEASDVNTTYFKVSASTTNNYTFVYKIKNVTTDNLLVTAIYKPYAHHYVNMTNEQVKALNNGDTLAYQQATCTAEGYRYKQCSVCGYAYKQTLAPLNHMDEAGNSTTIITGYKAPTCETTGLYATASCSLCGRIVKTEADTVRYYDYVAGRYVEVDSADGIIPVTGHDYEVREVKQATCKEGGYELWVCKNNSAHTEKRNVTAIAPHTPVTIPEVAATCTVAGSTSYQKCTVCGAQVTAPKIVAAKGHTLIIVPAKDATCTENGNSTTYYYCTTCNCGFSGKPATNANMLTQETINSYVIPATGHRLQISDSVAPTCTKPGNTGGIVCVNCGFIPEGSVATTIEKLNHVFEIVDTIPADCTTAGYYKLKCKNCDAEEIQIIESALGHTPEEVDAKAPTCYEEGYDAYTKCAVCGEALTEKKVKAKLAHNLVVTKEGKEATCTEAGYTAEKTCQNENCGYVLASVEMPAKGHQNGTWTVVKPTCTTPGSRSCVCVACKKPVYQELPALGHDYQIIPAVAATCTTAGNTQGATACTRCGNTEGKIEPETIDALEHDYQDVIAVEATCYSVGYTAGKKCTRCGDVLEGIAEIPMLEHNWGEAIEAEIPATCYQEGKTAYYECQNEGCTATKGGEVTEKTAHTKGDAPAVEKVEPTCYQQGAEAWYICTVTECGVLFGGEAIPMTSHSWGDAKEAEVPPTCYAEGKTAVYQCQNEGCTATKGGEPIEKLAHTWSDIPTTPKKEATCIAYGAEAIYTCTVEGCGATKGGEPIEMNAEHTYGTTPSVAKIEPTCIAVGYEAVYACTVEGCTATKGGEVIKMKTEHTFGTEPTTAKVEPTCITDGKEAVYACTVEGCLATKGGEIIPLNPDAHNYGAWSETTELTCTQNEQRSRECSICHNVDVDVITYANGHKFNAWTVTKAATCVANGEMTRTCQNTGCTTQETYVIKAYGHIAQNVNEVPSTCTKKGIKAGVKCTRCGEYISGGEETEMKSHNFTVTVKGYKATCLVDGLTDTMRCSVCGVLQSSQEAIPAVGKHTEVVTIIYEASTCNHIGHSAEKKCSVCGKILQESKELPLTEHTFKITPAKQATCTTTGMTEGKVCTVCGLVAEKATVIPVQAHTYGDYTITTPSTCTTAGKKVRECTVCHTKQTENLMPNGHHAVFVKAVAVTCTKDGNVAYWTCEFCQGAYEEEALETPIDNVVITKLGHDFTKPADVASSDIKVATCTEDGYVLCRCKNSDCKEYVKLDKNDLTKLGETDLANLVTAKGHKGGVATCTKKRVCENCNQEYGELLDHTVVKGKVITHGDCRHRDVLNDYCSVCGKVVKEYYGSFGDHVYNDTSVVEIIPATCTQQGATITHCAIEGCDGYKSEYIATLAHKDADGDGICDVCGNVIPGSDADHLGTCTKCGRNHTSNGGLFGYDGLICKLIAFFKGFTIA